MKFKSGEKLICYKILCRFSSPSSPKSGWLGNDPLVGLQDTSASSVGTLLDIFQEHIQLFVHFFSQCRLFPFAVYGVYWVITQIE